MTGFPYNWFWIVGGDTSRGAWSSAARAYVRDWPPEAVTRIASEAELSDVLRGYGLRGPIVDAADVDAELVRRQCALLGMASPDAGELQRRILNGTREATELQNIKLKHIQDPDAPDWTPAQATWAAMLEYLEAELTRLEYVAETLKASLPADYANDKYWSA